MSDDQKALEAKIRRMQMSKGGPSATSTTGARTLRTLKPLSLKKKQDDGNNATAASGGRKKLVFSAKTQPQKQTQVPTTGKFKLIREVKKPSAEEEEEEDAEDVEGEEGVDNAAETEANGGTEDQHADAATASLESPFDSIEGYIPRVEHLSLISERCRNFLDSYKNPEVDISQVYIPITKNDIGLLMQPDVGVPAGSIFEYLVNQKHTKIVIVGADSMATSFKLSDMLSKYRIPTFGSQPSSALGALLGDFVTNVSFDCVILSRTNSADFSAAFPNIQTVEILGWRDVSSLTAFQGLVNVVFYRVDTPNTSTLSSFIAALPNLKSVRFCYHKSLGTYNTNGCRITDSMLEELNAEHPNIDFEFSKYDEEFVKSERYEAIFQALEMELRPTPVEQPVVAMDEMAFPTLGSASTKEKKAPKANIATIPVKPASSRPVVVRKTGSSSGNTSATKSSGAYVPPHLRNRS